MTDDLTRRAIIAAHGDCGCGQLNPGEEAIVALWRADVDAYRCTCPPEPDETVTGQCPIHGDMSAQAQGQRDYEHMAKLRQEAADRAETAEAAIQRALAIWREHTGPGPAATRCVCRACQMAHALDGTDATP